MCYVRSSSNRLCVKSESILHKKCLVIPRTHSSESMIFPRQNQVLSHSIFFSFEKYVPKIVPFFDIVQRAIIWWHVRIRSICTHTFYYHQQQKHTKNALALSPLFFIRWVFPDTRWNTLSLSSRLHFELVHHTTNDVIFRMRDFEYYLYWVNKFINLQCIYIYIYNCAWERVLKTFQRKKYTKYKILAWRLFSQSISISFYFISNEPTSKPSVFA